MSTYKIEHTEQRTVQTFDAEGGETLTITYFPAADFFTINGSQVTRAQTDEGMDELTIFVGCSDRKLITVVTSSLAKLDL
jgi:hypothetical protein